MLASITNESNLALTFQIFGIQIVVTGPGIALGVTGLGVSGSCADSSNGQQDMAKRVAEIKIS
jgi:hypothetical protein